MYTNKCTGRPPGLLISGADEPVRNFNNNGFSTPESPSLGGV